MRVETDVRVDRHAIVEGLRDGDWVHVAAIRGVTAHLHVVMTNTLEPGDHYFLVFAGPYPVPTDVEFFPGHGHAPGYRVWPDTPPANRPGNAGDVPYDELWTYSKAARLVAMALAEAEVMVTE